MIIRSLWRRPSVVRSLAAAPAKCGPKPFAHRIHTPSKLDNHLTLVENGVQDLLSAKGFKIAYTDYMEHLTNELNASTSGTPQENQKVKDLVLEWARNPEKAYDFNVASMLFNNHFFFNGINTDTSIKSQPSSALTGSLTQHFSSLSTLRDEFLATASAMFGPGFVWLVQLNNTRGNPIRILPTYLAGTPLSGAHYRRQLHDLNTHNPDSYENLNSAGAFGKAAQVQPKDKKPLGGVDVTPLLCVNTWEHVWLNDYGVAGKREFLEKWWEKINWAKVDELAVLGRPEAGSASSRRQFVYN